eukprot:1930977-Ditylum_brightwellii.AAC.1
MAALLEVWPDAAREKDAFGWTPLHRACEHGAPFEVVAALLKAWPGAVKEKANSPIFDETTYQL